MSNQKHLADLLKVCSILPALAIMPAMAETINIGTGETQTLTGMHTDAVVQDGSVYFLASEDKNQLAVLNIENAMISNVTTNYANKQSGFVKGYDNSKVVVKNSEFSDNKSDYYSAIWTVSPATGVDGGILEISDSKFLRNEAADGAAVGAMWLTDISNTLFEGNKATDANGDGGVLFLGAVSQSKLTDVTFKGNASAADGGAISMRSVTEGNNSDAKLDIFESEFSRNTAEKNGGAIYSTFYDSETVKDSVCIEDTDFTANSANHGGAIYTEGKVDLGAGVSSMKVVDSEFVGNIATNNGGAVYNGSKLVLEDSEFSKNDAYLGGAMFLAKGSDTTISDAEFDANTADFGGAIYTSTGIKNVDITDSTFTNNVALGAGAVGIFKKGTLTNVKFSGNKATDATDDGGGALFLGALSQVQLNNMDFDNNSSAAVGGAIATRYVLNANGTKNGMKDAMLDIVGGTFTGNIANTKGGAIYNTFYNSKNALGFAYVDDSTFTSNEALEGGAIYNVGIIDAYEGHAKMALNDVTFTGNKAAAFGGAIYNEEGGTIVLTGKNTFANNTAKGGANDIHNLGTLEIASGTTTIGGGISGTGSLAIAKGTVLNIGTSTIVQDKIEIDGTVTASVLSERSFGRLLGDVEADRDAKLELTVGSVGTYKIFDDDVDIDIAAGSAFVVTNNGVDGVVIETKSVEDLAADTGLTTNAAAVVAGLANADSRAMQQVSLAAQTALNAGDKATVEAEAAKVVPDNKPVAQSVAMSVQNQVVNMAANRMAAVTPMGRSGGDTPMAAGAWVQGMFNKSKLNDQFHGYSRGFALGGDTVIADAFTIGGGYAYGTTDVHADNRDTDIESSTVFMYAQYKPTNWYLNATLSYTMSEYEEHATVFGMPMVNTYDVDSYGAQMMTGYTFASGITPEMGVRYLYVESDDYNNGLGDITVDDTQYLAGVMGLKYAFEIESDWALKLRPELRAAATYDFLSDEAIATVTMPGAPAYVVNGDRLSRMGGEFGIGLTAEYKGLNVSLTYDLDLHKDYTSQTGMLKFRYNF